MDKKTILAVILITIVITVSMVIQGTMFSNNTTTENTTSTEQTAAESTSSTATAEAAKTTAVVPSSLNKSTEKFLIETDLYVIEFDPVGASISSLMLKEHADADLLPEKEVDADHEEGDHHGGVAEAHPESGGEAETQRVPGGDADVGLDGQIDAEAEEQQAGGGFRSAGEYPFPQLPDGGGRP